MQTGNSLSGKNTAARASGARSSRASRTLFKKLQKLDRKISRLDAYIQMWGEGHHHLYGQSIAKKKASREKLDQQRKEARELRKSQLKLKHHDT